MSVREFVARARSGDLVVRDEQVELTQDLVLPAMPELVDLVTGIRGDIDRHFRLLAKQHAGQSAPGAAGDSNLAVYPVGFCRPIALQVHEALSRTPLVRKLVDQGVVFKTVYIMLYGRYFQNAIQIGNLYLDAANDTVDPNKPFLEWMPISELDYRNLESWDEVISIVEGYYHCRVVPNRSFPLLAPFIPLFGIRSNGMIELMMFQDLFFFKDLGDGMRRYIEWISSGTGPAARVLSPEDEEMLKKEFGANDFDRFPFEYAASTPDDLVKQARDIVDASNEENGEMVIRKFVELAQLATRKFKQRGLVTTMRPANGDRAPVATAR